MRPSLPFAAVALTLTACTAPRPPEPQEPVIRAPENAAEAPALPDPGPEAHAPTEGPDADYAELVKRIPRRLDIDRVVEPYAGELPELKKDYDHDFATVHALAGEFEALATRDEPRAIVIRARLQQAALYDVLRQRLAGAEPPRVKLYTNKEELILDKAATSGDPNLAATAHELRKRREELFQSTRENWLQAAEAPMIRHYADALLRAKAWGLDLPEISRARARFAHGAELLGDAKVKAYTEGLVDPANGRRFVYSPGAFERP